MKSLNGSFNDDVEQCQLKWPLTVKEDPKGLFLLYLFIYIHMYIRSTCNSILFLPFVVLFFHLKKRSSPQDSPFDAGRYEKTKKEKEKSITNNNNS